MPSLKQGMSGRRTQVGSTVSTLYRADPGVASDDVTAEFGRLFLRVVVLPSAALTDVSAGSRQQLLLCAGWFLLHANHW